MREEVSCGHGAAWRPGPGKGALVRVWLSAAVYPQRRAQPPWDGCTSARWEGEEELAVSRQHTGQGEGPLPLSTSFCLQLHFSALGSNSSNILQELQKSRKTNLQGKKGEGQELMLTCAPLGSVNVCGAGGQHPHPQQPLHPD